MATKKNDNKNIEVYLEDIRFSHPHLFEPTVFQRKGKPDPNSKPRFTCGFILDKKKHKKKIAEIWDAIADVCDAKWGDPDYRVKEDNLCFKDGDDTDKPELQGCMLLTSAAPAKNAPTVMGRSKEKLVEKDGKPYGGSHGNALVRIYAYDEYDDQVLASLEAVQYIRKGEAFGKGPVDTSRFEELDEEDDDDVTPMRGSRRSREDDEDARPARSSRRSSREEDDDPPPRGRRAARGEEDDDRVPARRRDREADDEPAPRSRRASRDEPEDDEPPARRRGRGREEEDDEPAPRGRRRSSRED